MNNFFLAKKIFIGIHIHDNLIEFKVTRLNFLKVKVKNMKKKTSKQKSYIKKKFYRNLGIGINSNMIL